MSYSNLHKAWLEKYGRLSFFLESKGVSMRAAERLCGTYHKAFQRPTAFEELVRSKFAPAFPDANIRWILEGEGQMLGSGKEPTEDERAVFYEMIRNRDQRIRELEEIIIQKSRQIEELQELKNINQTPLVK
jgi:hypothetical protein